MVFLKIKPIRIGELQEKEANAICWQVNGLVRGATSATASCALVQLNDDGGSEQRSTFTVEIDNDTLQKWGEDDSVIDDLILKYSPLFEKAE